MQVPIKIPPLGESIEEAIIIEWAKKEGEEVRQDDMILSLETDKITLEVYAPTDGLLTAISSPAGAVVKSGSVVGLIEQDAKAKGAGMTRMAPHVSHRVEERKVVPKKPVAKKAEPAPFPTAEISGDENMDWLLEGRGIRSHDRSHFVAPSPVPVPVPVEVTKMDSRTERKTPLSPLRRRIAHRLKQAQQQAAILTTFNEVDMSEAINLRKIYGESFEKTHGVRLGYMSLFVSAAVAALKAYPVVNAYFAEDGITEHDYCDIGIAVSIEKGLVVPVLRDAQNLSMAAIEKKINSYAHGAREGKLKPQDLSGGTFTITNGGVFGSMLSTPILNPPQTAILGMHAIQKRAVVVDDTLAIRPIMYLALSYDHRLLDGKGAVLFLNHIKQSIEKPQRLLLAL